MSAPAASPPTTKGPKGAKGANNTAADGTSKGAAAKHVDPQSKAAGAPSPPPPPAASAAAASSNGSSTRPAATAGPLVSSMLPAGFKLSVITDATVRGLLEQEIALKNELNTLRGETRTLQDQRDANLREFQPQQSKFLANYDANWTKLQAQKNDLRAKMDQLRIQQTSTSSLRDELKMIDFETDRLRREIGDTSRQLEDANASKQQHERQRDATMARLPFKSASDADTEIAKLEKDIAAATKANNMTLANALTKSRNAAQKGKKEVIASYQIDDKILAETKRVAHLDEQVAYKRAKRAEFEEKRAKLISQLDESRTVSEQFTVMKEQMVRINQEIDTLKASRNDKKPVNSEIDGINDSLTTTRTRRDAINKQLDSIREQLHPATFSFPAEFKSELIGKQGATVEQLQQDFGVAVLFGGDRGGDRAADDGHYGGGRGGSGRGGGGGASRSPAEGGSATVTAWVIGGKADAENAVEAMKSIISHVEIHRQKSVLTIDPTLTPALIGARGSNVEKLQAASGARITIESKTGQVTLTGTAEALAVATKSIQEFIDNSATDELPFEAGLLDIVIGKGAATIKRIEKSSGVKNIRVNRETNKIAFFGHKTAVAAAKKEYVELIEGMTKNVFTMRADDRMARLVIGAGGKTIREITEQTQALIDVSGGNITVRGPKEAVAAARAMIEDLTRRDEIKIPYDPHMFNFLVSKPADASGATPPATTAEASADAPTTAVDDGEGGEPSKPKQTEAQRLGLCPLEAIRQSSGCDQVSAIRQENKVVLRGKKECVTQARLMLEELLRRERPDVRKIDVSSVLFSSLGSRNQSPMAAAGSAGGRPASFLSTLRQKYKNLLSCDFLRDEQRIELVGPSNETTPAEAELREHLAAHCLPFLRHIPIRQSDIRVVIGPGGERISSLQKKHKVDVYVDKEKNEVVVFSPQENADQADACKTEIEELVRGGGGGPRK